MLTHPSSSRNQNGSFRLVTAFTEVEIYGKPQPSLIPDVAMYFTPYHTTEIYQYNCPYKIILPKTFGKRLTYPLRYWMPGSETALYEIICRALGHLLEKGCVAELADYL